MTIDLDELARLEREATPVPWTVDDAGHREQDIANVVGPKQRDDNGSHWTIVSDCAPVKDGALIAAMRNALPGLIEELRHLRLGPGTCPNCGATWVNGLYARVYDRARRWKRLAKRLRRRNKFLARASRQYGAARAELAAMTERAERAEETIAIFTAPYEPDMKCGTFLPVDPVLEAARRPIRVDAAIWERRAEELRVSRAELAAMTERAGKAERALEALRDDVKPIVQAWIEAQKAAISASRAALKGEGET